MSRGRGELTLRQYRDVLARRWWIVLAVMVGSVLAAGVWVMFQDPVYEASSKILLQPRGGDSLFADQVVNPNERAVQTEIEVIEGAAVRGRAQAGSGSSGVPPRVAARAVGQTDVIELAVRSRDPVRAQLYADAYADAYIDLRRERAVEALLAASSEVQVAIDDLSEELASLPDTDPRRGVLLSQIANFGSTLDQLRVDAALRTGEATVVEPALLPTSPVEPQVVRTLVLAALLGLLGGLALAFIVEMLDDKVRSAPDVEQLGVGPVLAVIPDRTGDGGSGISSPPHELVEAYRGLRTNLQFLALDRSIEVVQVTSSIEGEGKTTTAVHLAIALARAGSRVALVDADVRRPRVHELLEVRQDPGLVDALLGRSVTDVATSIDLGNDVSLTVVASGLAPASPGEMLGGRALATVLGDLRDRFDITVIDSPPVLPVADALALASSVDAVLVVVQAGRTKAEAVVEAGSRLERVGAPVVGAVLNRSSLTADRYGSYGGYGHPTPPPEALPAPSPTAPTAPTPGPATAEQPAPNR